MRTTLRVAAAALLVAAASPICAADNYLVRDGAGAARTIRAVECGGTGSNVYCPVTVPSDAAGVPLGTPTNPTTTRLPAGAATDAKSEAIRALLAGTLTADGVVRSPSVDRGGVLTTAGTAQTLVPANPTRRGLEIQNRNAPGSSYSAATSVFVSCLAAATQDFHSLEVPAGALYVTPSQQSGTGACSFVSATPSTPVYVREF